MPFGIYLSNRFPFAVLYRPGTVPSASAGIVRFRVGVKSPVGQINALDFISLIHIFQRAGGKPPAFQPLPEQFPHPVFVNLKRNYAVRNDYIFLLVSQDIAGSAVRTLGSCAVGVHFNPGACIPDIPLCGIFSLRPGSSVLPPVSEDVR